MAKDQTMKALAAEIADKQSQVEKLQIEIDALQKVLDQLEGKQPETKQRASRGGVSRVVMELLEEVGPKGLNAHIACEMARSKGEDLKPKSVSSLLSRLTKDGALHYDNIRYLLKKHVKAAEQVSMFEPVRSSGIAT